LRTQKLFAVALGLLVSAWMECLPAQERERDAGANRSSSQTIPYGVPLAPPIYFVNFLFLYFSNPATAALMPAYRAPVPQQVYDCLLDNPDGCPYEEMAKYFREQADDRGFRHDLNTIWPSYCRTTEPWARLAPPVYQYSDQINEPLGPDRAAQLALALGLETSSETILTPSEYQCVMGVPPRDPAQEILYACFIDFTASKGNRIVVPFSSYGMNLNEHGNVLSLCAPKAPCLDANYVFLKLPEIALQCGFSSKLERLLTQTPVLQFIQEGGQCQSQTQLITPACIAPTTCPNSGGRSGCALPSRPFAAR
jgi:hypothetical protein